eukprot:CAMPEP_0194765008 /NCGR_PEP_ID=MMETSP0323_2-20130528/24398_1 /TAXON_ID=2866 ORGANISM="Crypthecodinium cohnii, Strain Seligo" /NCGR_SAMPLE_ID=MMETSP0323_2 /ASSEMBLY_ACC=CAM_ASM_000346 /LENGTH=42 /DNA_ID= /DNA_START= /DNA_END= /DNA_ORIENTATION=
MAAGKVRRWDPEQAGCRHQDGGLTPSIFASPASILACCLIKA